MNKGMNNTYKYLLGFILLAVGAGAMLFALMPIRSVAAARPASLGGLRVGSDRPGDCTPGWSQVPSPNVGANANYLTGVAAIASTDVWAVGYYSGTYTYETLIEHWDGTQWNVVPSPKLGLSNYLTGISAVSSTDI